MWLCGMMGLKGIRGMRLWRWLGDYSGEAVSVTVEMVARMEIREKRRGW